MCHKASQLVWPTIDTNKLAYQMFDMPIYSCQPEMTHLTQTV